MTTIPEAGSTPAVVRRCFPLLVALLLAIGVLVRGLPQFMGPDRYLQHYATEDGYLMLTIARNIAIGLGMSTAEGTMPTNGTQPATTFVWALGFLATGGDKTAGVWVALMLQWLAAMVSTWLLFRVAAIVLAGWRHGRAAAWLAAAAWTSSQRTCAHVMNCLETGFYALALLGFARAFFAGGDPLRAWTTRRSLGLGLILGLVFWVRIDAVFLIAVVCVVRCLFAAGFRFAPSASQLRSAIVTGATAVVVASPWLIYNKIRFGHFTPVSGISQSTGATFGANLQHTFRALTEYALMVVPFPQSVIGATWLVVSSVLVTLAVVAMAVLAYRRGNHVVRTALVVFGGFVALLFCYYGLMFGAAHFVTRYMFPASMVLAVLTSGTLVALWAGMSSRGQVVAFAAGGLGLFAIVGATELRTFQKSARHLHWQVVDFVRTLPATTWVAAVQSGTLGYFHDRTINLDGKVNPEALAALLQGDDVWHQYIVGSKAEFIIDWVGFARFPADHPQQYAGKMEVMVEDPENNLAVLRRVH